MQPATYDVIDAKVFGMYMLIYLKNYTSMNKLKRIK